MNGPTERERELEAEVERLHGVVTGLDREVDRWIDRDERITTERNEARARVAVLEQQIAAVEALHVEVEGDRYTGGGFCAECCDEWPCPTVLAAGVVDNPTEDVLTPAAIAAIESAGNASSPEEDFSESYDAWHGPFAKPTSPRVARYVLKRDADPTEPGSPS